MNPKVILCALLSIVGKCHYFFKNNIASAAANPPAITNFSIMPVCPWSVLISWEKPTVTNEVIKEYVLSGSVNATITSTDQFIFYYNDTKVIPGEEFKVTLTVNFEGGVESSSITKNVRIPAPRKFGIFFQYRYR